MSFRDPVITIHDIIKLLQLPSEAQWIELPGRYLYRNRISFGNIHIYYGNINKDCDFPLLEMTGQGCREFETYSPLGFQFLLNLAKDTEKYHMSRLDVAFDDHTGIFDIRQIEKDYRAKNFVSTSCTGKITVEIKRHSEAISVMTGVKSSDMYMRIYDKAAERGFYDGRHWVRLELVLKQDRATNFILNPAPIGKKLRGVIANYFRFVTPSKGDTNKSRWKMRKYWSDFLSNAERISVFTRKDIDYNLSRVHRYLFHQAGNSIEVYIRCVGLVKFLESLHEREFSRLSPKQKFLIRESEMLYKTGEQITDETIRYLKTCYAARNNADQTAEADPFEDVPPPEPPEEWSEDI